MILSFLLENCTAQAAAHPETFCIPDIEEIYGVDVGDFVKLIFKPVLDGELLEGGERMWVEVTHVGTDMLRGKLRNHPIIMEDWLQYDDEIAFHRSHIADLQRAE